MRHPPSLTNDVATKIGKSIVMSLCVYWNSPSFMDAEVAKNVSCTHRQPNLQRVARKLMADKAPQI